MKDVARLADSKPCRPIPPQSENHAASISHPHKLRTSAAARDNGSVCQCPPRSISAATHPVWDGAPQKGARPVPPTLARMAASSSAPGSIQPDNAQPPPAAGIPLIQFLQFHAQKGGLEFIQTRVKSFYIVVIFFLRPVIAQRAHPCPPVPHHWSSPRRRR